MEAVRANGRRSCCLARLGDRGRAGSFAIAFGLGGLFVFALVLNRIEFEMRGYRIRQLGPKARFVWTLDTRDCRYEERTASGGTQSLPFTREIVGGGYPAPSRVHLPSEATWDSRVAPWARGRRHEIVERITK